MAFDLERWQEDWDEMLALWEETMKAEDEEQMTRLFRRAATAEAICLWRVVYAVASGEPKDIQAGLKAAKIATAGKSIRPETPHEEP